MFGVVTPPRDGAVRVGRCASSMIVRRGYPAYTLHSGSADADGHHAQYIQKTFASHEA